MHVGESEGRRYEVLKFWPGFEEREAGYLERKRAEDKMINKVKQEFGKDVVVFYGDWSTSYQMKSFAPTPNKRIKRKFVENFDVYNLDEFRTSKLHWETEQEGDNLRLPDRNRRLRKIHAIKTFTMVKNRNTLGCINRDRNACLNMWKLVTHYLDTGEWLPAYKRSEE